MEEGVSHSVPVFGRGGERAGRNGLCDHRISHQSKQMQHEEQTQHCGTVQSLHSSRNSSAQGATRSKSLSHHPTFLKPPGSTYFVSCPRAPFLCFLATQLHQKSRVSGETAISWRDDSQQLELYLQTFCFRLQSTHFKAWAGAQHPLGKTAERTSCYVQS